MKDNEQPGFSLLEVFLIIAGLAVVGFGAWYLWSQSNNTEYSVDRNEPTEDNQQAGVDVSQNYRVDYTQWKKSEDVSFRNSDQHYDEVNGTASLSVYKFNNPRIYYSYSAPEYCKLVDQSWVAFIEKSTDGQAVEERLDGTEVCNSLSSVEIEEGVESFETYGGALGARKFIVASKVADSWLIVEDVASYSPDATSEDGIDELNSELKNSVYQLLERSIVAE